MRILIAVAAAAALIGCSQPAPGASDASNPAPPSAFPNLFSSSYRAEATIKNSESGELTPIVIYRSGRKQRIELAANGGQTAVVSDTEANEGFIVTQQGGRRMAMRMSLGDQQMHSPIDDWTGGRATTFVGPCAGAGQVGGEWSMTPTEEEPETRTACVTSDGILLKATEDGEVVWETTSVSRGPQDGALFTPPADAVDMSAMAAQMKAAIDRAKAAGQ